MQTDTSNFSDTLNILIIPLEHCDVCVSVCHKGKMSMETY